MKKILAALLIMVTAGCIVVPADHVVHPVPIVVAPRVIYVREYYRYYSSYPVIGWHINIGYRHR